MNFFIILPQLTVHNIISPERFSITKKQQPRNGLYLRRSEEHTSELQSQSNLVCRLLLEKKKKRQNLRAPSHGAAASRISVAPARIAHPCGRVRLAGVYRAARDGMSRAAPHSRARSTLLF